MSKTETTTVVANKQADNDILLLNIQVENQVYCMTMMQVAVVAFLGVTESPGRSAVKLAERNARQFSLSWG